MSLTKITLNNGAVIKSGQILEISNSYLAKSYYGLVIQVEDGLMVIFADRASYIDVVCGADWLSDRLVKIYEGVSMANPNAWRELCEDVEVFVRTNSYKISWRKKPIQITKDFGGSEVIVDKNGNVEIGDHLFKVTDMAEIIAIYNDNFCD